MASYNKVAALTFYLTLMMIYAPPELLYEKFLHGPGAPRGCAPS